MKDKLHKWIKSVSLMDVIRLCIILNIIIHLIAYVNSFPVWNVGIADKEDDDSLSAGVSCMIQAMGLILPMVCMCFSVSYIKNRIASGIGVIVVSFLQLFLIGDFGSYGIKIGNYQFFYNIIWRLEKDLQLMAEAGCEQGISYYTDALNGFYIIRFIVILQIVLAVTLLVLITMKKEKIYVESSNLNIQSDKKSKRISFVLQSYNVLLALGVMFIHIYHVITKVDLLGWIRNYEHQLYDKDLLIKWILYYGINYVSVVTIPFMCLFICVASRFIKEKKYVLVAFVYAMSVSSIRNCLYHSWRTLGFYNSLNNEYREYSIVVINDVLYTFLKVGVVIFILLAVWKYVGQRICNRLNISKKVKKRIIIATTGVIGIGVITALVGKAVLNDKMNKYDDVVFEYYAGAYIDEYSIYLEEAFYDKYTEVAFCELRVSKSEGKVEADIALNGIMKNAFGEDGRINLGMHSDTGGLVEMRGRYDGDDLLISALFSYHNYEVEDDGMICIFNNLVEEDQLQLSPTAYKKKINADKDTTIYISPAAVKISSVDEVTVDNICLYYEDGKMIEIISDGKVKGSSHTLDSEGQDEKRITYISKKVIDVAELEAVEYNGNRYVADEIEWIVGEN